MSEPITQERRIELLGNAFVSRKIERDIHASLDKVRATRLHAREPSNVVIWGETGVEKSFIIEQYLAKRCTVTEEHGNLRQDLIAIELEGATSPVLIAAEMAAQLGLEDLPKGRTAFDAGPITQAVKHQMLMQGVEMVIIDEFHHIAPNEGTGTASRVARWVKSLAKKKERSRQTPFGVREANIPIVMVGTRKVHDLPNCSASHLISSRSAVTGMIHLAINPNGSSCSPNWMTNCPLTSFLAWVSPNWPSKSIRLLTDSCDSWAI